MKIDLTKEIPLGHYETSIAGISRYEYQFGQTLVFVEYPIGEFVEAYLDHAQSLIEDAWNDIPNAILYAEEVLKYEIPSGWEIFYKKKYPENEFRVGHWLLVYSIEFRADKSLPIYFISKDNFTNLKQELVMYREDDYWKDYPREFDLEFEPFKPCVHIRRISANIFEVVK